MAQITITIEDDLLRRARLRALQDGTTVNVLLRTYLETFVVDEGVIKRQAIVEHADTVPAAVGERTWTRSDLHEPTRRFGE